MLDPQHSLHCLLNQSPDAVMLAYLRSAAFLAFAFAALVGADARPEKRKMKAKVSISITSITSRGYGDRSGRGCKW
jgi:hypothetical protein